MWVDPDELAWGELFPYVDRFVIDVLVTTVDGGRSVLTYCMDTQKFLWGCFETVIATNEELMNIWVPIN